MLPYFVLILYIFTLLYLGNVLITITRHPKNIRQVFMSAAFLK